MLQPNSAVSGLISTPGIPTAAAVDNITRNAEAATTQP